jgi:LPS-assembly protein
VDGGLIFERFTDLGGKNMLQTLEPRLYYQYSEFEEQNDQPDFDSGELTFSYNQLFRSTRFSGKDRLDDSNQLAVGLTTRFIDSEDGRDVFSGSLGQIFYFRDRKVRLSLDDETLDDSSSEIAGELTFNPSEEFGLRTSLIYDPQSGNMNSGHVSASYQDDRGGIFNLGYSYRRPQASLVNQQTTEEASLSTYLPLGNNWSAFAAINYSMVSNESVEDMVGVEYDSCCWTVRVLHLRYYNNVSGETVDFDDPDLERENTIQFQIILKGMGGFGDRITDIMEDMIRGFEERDY